jgi:hypothetical protein
MLKTIGMASVFASSHAISATNPQTDSVHIKMKSLEAKSIKHANMIDRSVTKMLTETQTWSNYAQSLLFGTTTAFEQNI